MGTAAVWKTLDKMMEELKKKGAPIAPAVVSDLNSAKALLGQRNEDCINGDTLQKIDSYLQNVEANLVLEAQKLFGEECANDWLRRIDVASRRKTDEIENQMTSLPSGVPRGQRWIRMRPSESLSDRRLSKLAHQLELSYTLEEDGFIIVHGKEEALKDLVKRIAALGKMKTVKK